MIGYIAQTKGGQNVEILDKIEIAEPVYKYGTQYEANRHGFNLHDGANKIGEVLVTGYVVLVLECKHNLKKRGDILVVKPSDITRII